MSFVNRARLEELISASGQTAQAISVRAGLGKSAIRDILNGKSRKPAAETIAAIANALGISLDVLIDTTHNSDKNSGPTVTAAYLPVLHKVQAGAWFEVDVTVQAYSEAFPVAADERYANHSQWLEEVVGDSMNLVVLPGSFVHVVDALSLGREWKAGDLVIVERTKDGGHTRERTVKEVQRDTADEIELWPRSSNPRWQTPFTKADLHQDDIEVRIVGLVIGTYRRL